MKIFFILAVFLVATFFTPAHGGVMLVENGRASAVVVIARTPSQTSRYAAEELVAHVEKASGVRLNIVSEPNIPEGYKSRVYLGMTDAGRSLGADIDLLSREEFILRTRGSDLFIIGKEGAGDPLEGHAFSNPWMGTLWGVYEFLERYVGVRWVWPGELGTYVPRSSKISVGPVDETIAPDLVFRHIRWSRVWGMLRGRRDYPPEEERLGFSREGLEAYGRDLLVFMRRHRMGGNDRRIPNAAGVGHYFEGWWDSYGSEHPEWFMMREDGKRGPEDGRDTKRVPMCVSNPGLHRYIVEEVWDGRRAIQLGEVDRRAACQCPECKAWDASSQVKVPPFLSSEGRSLYHPRITSDRYARFWRAVYDLAVKRNPDAVVTTFLYFNYFPTPLEEVELGEGIYGEFVAWGDVNIEYFPMEEQAFIWLKEQWLGWRKTGIRLSYRPNYLLDGYVMPLINLRQAAEFFKFTVENGSEGADFDSLTGQWATQGPKLYLHMRLLAKPGLEIENVLDEYYEVFGPASAKVREYFDYWERYCLENIEHFKAIYENLSRYAAFQRKAHLAFPQGSFEPAERILSEALKEAQGHPDSQYASRVRFLQLGLEHARLSARLAECFDGERNIVIGSQRFKKATKILRELADFRRRHESLYISDYYTGAVVRERQVWNIDRLLLFMSLEEETSESYELLPAQGEMWEFRMDPYNKGFEQGWHKSENESGSWISIPVPAWWRETEVGDYLGYGWYRTGFIVPDELEGKTLRFHFEGVDEQGWVFVNGFLAGEQSVESTGKTPGELWNLPFTVDVPPDYIKAGKKNLLVIRVHAHAGQAGIYRPVSVSFL